MRTPTIHLNGTSQDELQAQIDNASAAIFVAISELQKAAPNGRDYYPQGPDAIGHAMEEHRSRLARLEAVADEVAELQAAIGGYRTTTGAK